MRVDAVWSTTLLASVLSASVAVAESCSISFGANGSVPDLSASGAHESNDHQDLGNGTILSQQSTWDGHTATNSANYRLEFCVSGQAISIFYMASCLGEGNPYCEEVGLSGPGSFEADRASIKSAILGMAVSDNEYSLIEFTERLEGLGARLRTHDSSGNESCGCAAFYPELIGEKRPNQFREANGSN